MVLSIRKRIKGFLFTPSEAFDTSKEDTLDDAFKYFFVILVIPAVLIAVVSLFAGMGPLYTVGYFILVFVCGISGVFIAGLLLHLGVYVVGGRKGVTQTIKALMYGATPGCLLGWIPLIGFFAGIWSLIVDVIGIRQLHGLSTGKAVLAVIIAIIIPALAAIIFGAIIAALIPMMLGPIFPRPAGPGFGGY